MSVNAPSPEDYIRVDHEELKNFVTDIFLALGVDKWEAAIIVTTSEGRSRREILRHWWATMKLLWNLDFKAALRLLEVLKAS